MEVRASASIVIARPLEEVFDFAVDADAYPRVLLPVGPVAGIAEAEMVDGVPLAVGAVRRIRMTDGAELMEDIRALERPRIHRYGWTGEGLKAPFRWLVRAGEGEWTFSSEGEGTRIEWRYRFELTTPVLAPLGWLTVVFFERWMNRGLGRIAEALTGN